MLPLVLVGSFVGVIISSILPEAVLTIIVAALLFYLLYDSFDKAIGLWKKETIAIQLESLAFKELPGAPASELSNIQTNVNHSVKHSSALDDLLIEKANKL